MNPLVTIYITNFNYGRYLKKAIESVLNQTYENYELLIIDDGSTDNSKEIIEEYVNHPKIKIIYQKNKGLIVTNNIALRAAQGKYLMRLDADDYLDENALLVMVKKIESDPEIGLVYPDYFIIDADENIINVRKREPISDVKVKDDPAHGACTLIRLSFLKEIGGYNEQYIRQDGYYLWINFISRYKIANVSTPLFYYRNHGLNSTTIKENVYETRAEITKKFSLNNKKVDDAVAILPIRGPNYNTNSIALRNINDKKVIDIKLSFLLNAELVSKIVVTTPDDTIIRYINDKYNNNRIIVHKRKPEFARLNVGLVETVNDIFDNYSELKKTNYFFTNDLRYPFVNSNSIDGAIKAIQLFESENLFTVRPDNSKFFQRSSDGLKVILNQDKFTKLEREDLYRYCGGIILSKKSFFDSNQTFYGGMTSHFIIKKNEEYALKDDSDFLIAESLISAGIISLL